MSLRSRRKRKAWGASPRNESEKCRKPAKAGVSGNANFMPSNPNYEHSAAHFRGLIMLLDPTWGSAALHPRLYATACSAGWSRLFDEL